MTRNRWGDPSHARDYLGVAETIPHRREGESELLDQLPAKLERVLDLGCGDGRLLALVREARPGVAGVALDFSELMLSRAKERFAVDADVAVVEHDLDSPLPALGQFDAVISSFAIHHLGDERKRQLFGEVFLVLRPGGAFLNLEHVSSPTGRLHQGFMAALGVGPGEEDPSNRLSSVGEQLRWLSAVGFEDVDCHWKWRELALLAGVRPSEERPSSG